MESSATKEAIKVMDLTQLKSWILLLAALGALGWGAVLATLMALRALTAIS
jgi:hypothetical protein